MSIPKVKSTSFFTGNLKSYVNDPLNFLVESQKKYGDVFKFRLAYRYLNFLYNPEYVKHILQENHRGYIKSLAYRKLMALLGNGLFTDEGQSWLENRRLIQPAFHNNKVQKYFEIIKLHANKMSETLDRQQEINVMSESTQVTLNIITDTLFGVVDSGNNDEIEENLPFALKYMIKRVTSSLNSPMWFPSKKNRKFKKVTRSLKNIIFKILEQKKKEGYSDDLLSWLMQIQDEDTLKGMTKDQLKDEILTFYLAGHETTAVSLTWGLYYLLNNDEVLEKLQNEINTVNPSVSTEWKEINKMGYLDLVVKEILRKASPIWVLGREAIKDDDFDEFKLKKGESVIFSPFMLHHHEDYWGNPDSFNPDRFKEEIAPNTYLPFGAGPRQCIGNNFAIMELKVLLTFLLANRKLQLMTGFPGHDYSLTLRPKNEVIIKIVED